MKSVLKAGACVSCGRASGRYYRTCPYCGEEVWQPAWRRTVCRALLALPPLLAVALMILSRPDGAALAQAARTVSPMLGFLFAAGVGLLLTPQRDDDLVVSSQAELVRWQSVAVGGALLCGGYAAVAAVGLCFGRATGVAAWLSGVALAACVIAAPFFFRVPWRALVAAALIAGAIALG
jgi:hypothetical protein